MKLPAIEAMWPHLPLGEKAKVATLVGGTVGASITKYDWDTCCIRVSRALNYSGADVSGWSKIANPYMTANSNVRAQQGADKKWYIFSCYDLRVYLNTRYGAAKKFVSKADEAAVKGTAGIIMFGFLHVDLWDGEKICNHSYFGDARIKSDNVLIWPAGPSVT